ncbi:DUF5815 family protein [Halopenitus persicus]|uniref:Uncharacterized protein n=1 Tax=Halopenitus persicus TaxID=1048396 RepID=A0A1H3KRM6_9EURY|nr:DUF5815 family protein [Halopenitus persicus]SDY54659.1 hypothetical protein SAMN05216564_106121 [Halopenitus persicus]
MSEPRVPGTADAIELPCGETIGHGDLDLGMREYDCACGETHAVVMDVHPPERFLPEFLVEVLREAVETTSEEMPEFGTPHLLGVVLEEFPDRVVAEDASENADVGYALVWVAEFDARRLHEVIVELVVELMEHAVSHAEDDGALQEFEKQMTEFDVAEFVERYRAERDLEAEDPYA